MRPPITDEPLLRSASLSHMRRLLRELRAAENELQIHPDAVSALKAGELLQAGAHLTGCDEFGLLLGARHRLADLGATGFLLMAAPTAQAMLQVLDRHGHLIQDRALRAVVDARATELYYTTPLRDPAQRRQDAEFSMAYIVGSVRTAVGSALAPLEVCFEHDAPASTRAHRALFGCPVRFNRPYNRVVWGRSVGEMDLVSADPMLFDHLGAYIESGFGADLDEKELVPIVRGVIASLLPQGEPSLSAVACRLDLSTRTLQRKLALADARFGGLIDKTRRELAGRYVASTNKPMVEIAQLLGYSEAAAFNRSYRRWYRKPPGHHRT